MTYNLATLITDVARDEPERVAIITEDGQLTYGDLDATSNAVASGLVAAGLKPGDPVGLQLPNIPQFVTALYGILKAGGYAIPMNVLNKGQEISYFLSFAGATLMITDASCAREAGAGMADAGGGTLYVVGEIPEGVTATPYAELEGHEVSDPPLMVPRDPSDTAVLLYTSGTTGKPKGVQLTHFQLYMNAGAHNDGFSMDSGSVTIAVMPLFHALGLSGILNATFRVGGTVVLLPKFDVEKVLSAVQTHKATILHGVPTMHHAVLNSPVRSSYDLSSLKRLGSAGAAIAAEILDALEGQLGVEVVEMYGLTETGPVATMNYGAKRKPYSIGQPIRGVDIEIWDENKQRLPRGAEFIGEMVIRGHNTMAGYLNNVAATAEAFTDGWLHSGDLAYMDEDGFLFFAGRKKELIIRGGYNVYPREVEEVLYQHPAISEAAVVGIPDERLGEEVKAFVTLKEGQSATPDEITEFVKARLAAYKYPRVVQVIESMPKGATNKILKRELLEQYPS